MRVPLSFPFHPLNKTEQQHVNTLCSTVIGSNYFYSESYSVTKQFPNSKPVAKGIKNDEFVWNESLRKRFVEVGLENWCIVLIQGMARSIVITDRELINEANVALIARRSSKNPSSKNCTTTGLNVNASPPNEYEIEFIMYTVRDRPSGKSDVSTHTSNPVPRTHYVREVQWSSYVMRTGTIPTTREETIPDGISQNKKSVKYWERLLCRYGGGCPLVCFIGLF